MRGGRLPFGPLSMQHLSGTVGTLVVTCSCELGYICLNLCYLSLVTSGVQCLLIPSPAWPMHVPPGLALRVSCSCRWPSHVPASSLLQELPALKFPAGVNSLPLKQVQSGDMKLEEDHFVLGHQEWGIIQRYLWAPPDCRAQWEDITKLINR